MSRFFAGRTLGVATQHGKEKIIAPVLQAALGLSAVVALPIDTDVWGTFSGEIARTLDPLAAAKAKAKAALDLGTTDLVLASEGSFGPHPAWGFVPANEEILYLEDALHQRHFQVKTLSTATNFAAATCADAAALTAFAHRVQFPAHALILRNANHLHKGIATWSDLEKLAALGYPWEASTDMRAHLNPSRQKVIVAAAEALLELLQSNCPQCGSPGFGVTETVPGLPCSWCAFPTRLTKAWIKTCAVCHATSTVDFPQGDSLADPQYCDRCNP